MCPSKLFMPFVQLSLTIVYIAGGVFISGWIGKFTFAKICTYIILVVSFFPLLQ